MLGVCHSCRRTRSCALLPAPSCLRPPACAQLRTHVNCVFLCYGRTTTHLRSQASRGWSSRCVRVIRGNRVDIEAGMA
eukprot:449691-Pleurochrysis_carterae.AAC.1